MTTYKEQKKNARIAGIWYLVLALGAGYSWMFITNNYVEGSAVSTVQNILAAKNQYIFSIICSIIGQVGYTFLALSLYQLFKNVNQKQARLMLVFVVIAVPIMFVNIIFQTSALVLLNNSSHFTSFTSGQVSELASLLLRMNIIGVYVVDIFWGLWLFPLAYLTYRSGFIPKFIAFTLLLSGAAYISDSLFFIISPGIHSEISNYLSIPEALGEVVMLLWLLIKGVKKRENS